MEYQSLFTVRDLQNLRRASAHCSLRVIALIDFDSFYAQCESVRLNLPPDRPLAVVQFNHCIAVNYAAKDRGVKRIVSPEEAKKQCPDIVLQHVATWREGDSKWAYRDDAKEHMRTDKAALDPYRLQSRTAFELIKSKLPAPPVQKVEKASIDEVFLDLSAQVYGSLIKRYPILAAFQDSQPDVRLPAPPSTLLNWEEDAVLAGPSEDEEAPPDWNDVALCIGAEIVRSIRKDVRTELKYTCSAGIARNKTIAKLAAGHNKPDKQTVVRDRAIKEFYSCYKFTKIRGLGGKLGQKVEEAFDTDQMSELLHVSIQNMRSKLGADSGSWVYNVIRGNEYAEVVERTQLQSMLAAKTFVPKAAGMEQAEKWLRILAGDLMGRLEEQDATSKHRRPKVITLHHSINGRFGPTRSKQMQIPSGAQISANLLFEISRTLLEQVSNEGCTWPCLIISIAVSGFEDGMSDNRHIASFLTTRDSVKSELPANKEDVPSTSVKRKRDIEQEELAKSRTALSPLQSWLEKSMQRHGPQDSHLEPPTGTYSCPKCNEQIHASTVLEHLDWHVAQELQDAEGEVP